MFASLAWPSGLFFAIKREQGLLCLALLGERERACLQYSIAMAIHRCIYSTMTIRCTVCFSKKIKSLRTIVTPVCTAHSRLLCHGWEAPAVANGILKVKEKIALPVNLKEITGFTPFLQIGTSSSKINSALPACGG